MKLPLASNPLSLQAANNVSRVSDRLSGVFERLSSGLRISDAGDDAAGLALATNINSEAKVLEQGVRNLNDGISLTSIAEAALTELNSILARQGELANQAANSVLTFDERRALDEEFNALVDEFNRIIDSTEYNGVNVLTDPNFGVKLQGGFGSLGAVAGSLNDFLATTVGNLEYSSGSSISGSTSGNDAAATVGDFDGDGILDVALATSSGVEIHTGDGDGTFTFLSSVSLATSTSDTTLVSGDFNGDGSLDLAIRYYSSDSGDVETSALLNNGSGTLTETNLTSSVGGGGIYAIDVNNDGVDDIVETTGSNAYYYNGSGFSNIATGVSTSFASDPGHVGDFDGDGNQDLYIVDGFQNGSLYLGNGNGTFASAIAVGNFGTDDPIVADFDGDGYLDIVGTSAGTVTLYSGQGDGTFAAGTTFSATGSVAAAQDFNSDGAADLLIRNGGTISFYLGDRNGNFTLGGTDTLGSIVRILSFADLDGNNSLDIVTNDSGDYVPQSMEVDSNTYIAYQDLHTTEGAQSAISATEANMIRVENELGYVGGFQSRLESAVSSLQVRAENLRAAGSKILDADLASETADLVRLQVLQNSSTAILAQANLQPEIALSLLQA